MVVGDRTVEGRCCPPHLRRPCSSVVVKRSPTRAVLASSLAPRAVGSMASPTSIYCHSNDMSGEVYPVDVYSVGRQARCHGYCLFKYDERKLYGLFEATSDGATDIVPMAFSSSRKLFSAQDNLVLPSIN
ncbi:hypothetical protein Taro_045138 [Colocasia esculenta]|uniref:DCD domain-containing protein n=1 Tax=Colocasia esculenta TaxID=4460 RepID=A0A843X263_COLES|nr:hypothetical protein [Colocasia esculenta]